MIGSEVGLICIQIKRLIKNGNFCIAHTPRALFFKSKNDEEWNELYEKEEIHKIRAKLIFINFRMCYWMMKTCIESHTLQSFRGYKMLLAECIQVTQYTQHHMDLFFLLLNEIGIAWDIIINECNNNDEILHKLEHSYIEFNTLCEKLPVSRQKHGKNSKNEYASKSKTHWHTWVIGPSRFFSMLQIVDVSKWFTLILL